MHGLICPQSMTLSETEKSVEELKLLFPFLCVPLPLPKA